MNMFEKFFKPAQEEVKKPIQKKPIEKPVILNSNLDQYGHPRVTFTEEEMAARGLTADAAEKKAKIAASKIEMKNPFERFKQGN